MYKKPAEGWSDIAYTQELIPSGGYGTLGHNGMAISEDHLVIGAATELDNSYPPRTTIDRQLFVFGKQAGEWVFDQELATIAQPQPGTFTNFTQEILLNDQYLVVTAPDATNAMGRDWGQVYVYDVNTWDTLYSFSSFSRLEEEAQGKENNFGINGALKQDTLLITMTEYPLAGAEVFVLGQEGAQPFRSLANPSEFNVGFGNATAITTGHFLMGVSFWNTEYPGGGGILQYDASDSTLSPALISPAPSLNGSFYKLGHEITLVGDVPVFGTYIDYSTHGEIGLGTTFVGAPYAGTDMPLTRLADSPINGKWGRFGHQMATDGTQLVISATTEEVNDSTQGVVYVYASLSDTQPLKITNDTLLDEGNFGDGLLIDGDQLWISAPFRATKSGGAGVIYYYKKVNGEWQYSNQIESPDVEGIFGPEMAWNGQFLFVGNSSNNSSDSESVVGTVYIYEQRESAWELVQTLDPRTIDAITTRSFLRFGLQVAVDEDELAVLAQDAIYIFANTSATWEYQAALYLTESERLGERDGGQNAEILFADGQIVLGRVPYNRREIPAAYLYERPEGGWQDGPASDTLMGPASIVGADGFGWTLGRANDILYVGAREKTEVGTESGVVYIFQQLPNSTISAFQGQVADTLIATEAHYQYTFDAALLDPFGGSSLLSVTLINQDSLPAWLSYDPATGTLSGTPAESDIGIYTLAYKIGKDDASGVASYFRLEVAPASIVGIPTPSLRASVYPNPSQGQYTLAFRQAVPVANPNVQIYNAQGQLVSVAYTWLQPGRSLSFRVEGTPGLYYLRYQNTEGQQYTTRLWKHK